MRCVNMVAAAALAMAGFSPALAADPTGVWVMSSGKVTVRVNNCGKGLCGSIIALKKPLSKDGKPKVDKENPDPALRSRPLIGLSILKGVKPESEGVWVGAIYNPDDGRTYSAKLWLEGDVMKVQGCVAAVLCKTNKFVRAN